MHDIVIVDERRNDEREQIREGREQRFPRIQKFRPRYSRSPSLSHRSHLTGESLEFVARNVKLQSI